MCDLLLLMTKVLGKMIYLGQEKVGVREESGAQGPPHPCPRHPFPWRGLDWSPLSPFANTLESLCQWLWAAVQAPEQELHAPLPFLFSSPHASARGVRKIISTEAILLRRQALLAEVCFAFAHKCPSLPSALYSLSF